MKKQISLSVIVGLLAFCSSSHAQNPPFIPRSAESAGLTRIVPDTLVWISTNGIPKIGGYVEGADVSPGGSVEATARLLGDSTFLIAASLKATNDVALMARNLVLIPVAGGTPKLDSELYDDAGQIYLRDSNTARQDGNPGRVGGDMRYGAVNYMTAFEATLFQFPASFNSDGRFTNPFFDALAAGGGRSYAAQNFQVNPLTLAVTPLHKSLDPMFYPTHTNDTPIVGQTGRSGSSPYGLANGNFVTVGEDRSGLNNSSGNAAIATIFAPDGTIVKQAFMVNYDGIGSDMWDNAGAWRGGFFAKPAGGITYFFDNDGNSVGNLTNNVDTGLTYDTGRSDGTRMCSDIRSHYVFIAGPAGTNIWMSVWDAKTRLWITNTIVSNEGNQEPTDLGGTRRLDRCNLACDAYNRVTVAYRLSPDATAFTEDQIAARVFQFDGTKFTPLTPTFFAFIQHDGTNNPTPVGFQGHEPSVAMTPREILIYAEGLWNGIPNATNPPVTAVDAHCYTILSHPAPIAAPKPQMTLAYGTPNSTISWLADAGLFTLQSTTTLPGGWTDVSPQPAITRTGYVDTNDKYQMSVPTGTGTKYYRLVRNF